MKRWLFILSVAVVTTVATAQVSLVAIVTESGNIILNYQDRIDFYERNLNSIKEIGDTTWVAVPTKMHFNKHDLFAVVDGIPVKYRVLPSGRVQLRDLKTEMMIFNFSTKEKEKKTSNSGIEVRPKRAKEKIERALKKMKKK